jgi:hypothetical protein
MPALRARAETFFKIKFIDAVFGLIAFIIIFNRYTIEQQISYQIGSCRIFNVRIREFWKHRASGYQAIRYHVTLILRRVRQHWQLTIDRALANELAASVLSASLPQFGYVRVARHSEGGRLQE